MKIAVAQLNLTVGDLPGNARRLRAAAEQARSLGARVLLTPELSLNGYPPEDLLLREDFLRASESELTALADCADGIVVVVGLARLLDGRRYNAAAVLRDRAVAAWYHKLQLPNYDVFDEER